MSFAFSLYLTKSFNMQVRSRFEGRGELAWKLLTGSKSKNSWQPNMSSDTTTSSYWINWRVLLCAIWVLVSMSFALSLIWKNEGWGKPRHETERGKEGGEEEEEENLYEDETWKPCLKGIHPAWLLSFRIFAFFVLIALLFAIGFVDGGSIFYYYTQWTFTSVTIYFGLGSLLSISGCYKYHNKVNGERVDDVEIDMEHGSYASSVRNSKNQVAGEESLIRKPANIWGRLFQIIFQMNAGAVMLTDSVFWFIIVPFLAIKDYNLSLLDISMHTVNAVFLFGDTALNTLRFRWFRIGYFYIWTIIYVFFQWIVHACVRIWWPYPFLDLSSRYAPLWYFSVAIAPLAVSDAAMLAPEGMFSGKGDIKEDGELTQSERKRRRANKKRKFKANTAAKKARYSIILPKKDQANDGS